MNGRIDGPANYATSVQAQREYEIPQVLTRLFQEIERYENLCCQISDKVSSVVTPCPTAPDCPNIATGPITQLAREINNATCRIKNISDDLESLKNRVEL